MSNHSSFISQPIFLVGADRSGTTVTRLMLSHHPQLALLSEFSYAVEICSDAGELPSLNQYYEHLESHRIFQYHQFKIDQNFSYTELVNSFLLQHQQREKKPLIGATVHLHFDRLTELWPDARFIHLVRDGRDVARSWIGMGWGGTVWNGLNGWMEAEMAWERLKPKITPEQWIEIHYEDLIASPSEALTKVCEFIGVQFEQSMFDYAETFPYDRPNPDLIQQWRHKLSTDEIQMIEAHAADLLVARGYELSGLPLIKLNALTRKQIQLKDWWGRFQARRECYGLGRLIANSTSKILNLKSWQKQIRQEMNQIEQSVIDTDSEQKMRRKQLQKVAQGA